jgi:hypothetical protein
MTEPFGHEARLAPAALGEWRIQPSLEAILDDPARLGVPDKGQPTGAAHPLINPR